MTLDGDRASTGTRRTDLESITVGPDDEIHRSVAAIEAGQTQMALVVDLNNKLIGTITDGDIRRGLLRGDTLSDPSSRVMNTHFRSIASHTPDHEAVQIMKAERYLQMPILDSAGRLTALLILHDFFAANSLPNSVVLMAGGRGRRLLPMTDGTPKPMLAIGNRPLLQVLLEECIDAGIRSIFISVGHLKDQIIDYFGDGSHWGVNIEYLIEDEPLGTAGALSLLPPNLQNPFFVINGDLVTNVNLKNVLTFHSDQQVSATLCARLHEVSIPFGVVTTTGPRLLHIDEKPVYRSYVNAGLYILEPHVLPRLPHKQYLEMTTLLDEHKDKGGVAVFPLHEYWTDIGSPNDFRQAQERWAKR